MTRRSPSLVGRLVRPRALRTVATLAAGVTVLAACGAGGGTSSGGGDATNVKEVHLGVILPLTGSTAQNGNNSRQGIELAADQINKAGGIKSMGGAQIKLDVADSTSDPAQAATKATQFLSRGTPPLAIIGAYASGLTTTVAQVTERKRVPLLSTAFADELTAKGYQNFFQLPAKATVVGAAQMQYAKEIAEANGTSIRSAAIVYANNAYGETQAKGLQDQAKKDGINVTLVESYAPDISDAGPVASKVVGSQPDAIFSVAYVTDGVLLMRALKAAGNTAPVIGGVGGYITPDFKKSLGDQVNGVLSVDTSDPDQYGDIGQAYQDKYGELMPQEAHDNAAAVYVFAEALENKPTTDSATLSQELRAGTFSQGAAGSMPGGKVKFDETGANEYAKPLMVQWQAGNLVGVWPAELTANKPAWTGKP
jgi:branched-chain amino acid transport system substrate-binding protein